MGSETFDTGIPHSARVYDYLLGGKDNFQVDRDAAEKALEHLPSLRTTALANRGFLVRAARHLAAERGVTQFLDIGTGLPTSPNLHEIVQAVDPRARVVYMDHDPLVLVHSRALLTNTPEGRTAYVQADLRDTDSLLAEPGVRETLDLTQPVTISLVGIMHFIIDDEAAHRIVSTLMEPLVPGSALMLSTVTTDVNPDKAAKGFQTLGGGVIDSRPRTREEVEAFFHGLQLVEPGVVQAHRWRPDPTPDAAHEVASDEDAPDEDAPDKGLPAVTDENVHIHCGVALKM